MASPAVGVSTGITLTFATTSWAPQVTSVKHGAITRKAIDTTHHGTGSVATNRIGNASFTPGKISDPGELEIEGHFNPDTIPPIDKAAETVTVGVPGSSTPATWAATMFMTEFEWTGMLEEKLTFRAKVKISGNITPTAGT